MKKLVNNPRFPQNDLMQGDRPEEQLSRQEVNQRLSTLVQLGQVRDNEKLLRLTKKLLLERLNQQSERN